MTTSSFEARDLDDFTPEQLEASIEGPEAEQAEGMHAEVFGADGAEHHDAEEMAAIDAEAAGAVSDQGAEPQPVPAYELEEEPDEVEPGLDVVLNGLLAGPEADDEDEAASGDGEEYVRRASADEFVCAGCFLIWSRRQLADARRRLCRDCVDVPGLLVRPR